jgi:hypothetical protein
MAVIEEALAMMEGLGPEFGPIALSNHGPMAAEALLSLGRPEEVEPWVSRYRKRLVEPPARVERINQRNWTEALGEMERSTDWEDFFASELDAEPWRAVLERWTVRLSPGVMAGATHGIIRTAHAVRSLAANEASDERLAELGRGLAYWAARYQVLPGIPGPEVEPRLASEALPRLAIMPPKMRDPQPVNIFYAAKELDAFAPFAEAINLASPGDDLSAWISDLTVTMANLYLQNAGPGSIPYVHTVTAPSALRMIAPHVSEATARLAARYTWQACAAIHSRGHLPRDVSMPDVAPEPADLIDRAVFSGDEHAIKFTEACLRENALRPDPAFLAGPLDMSNRFGRKRREGEPTNP